MLFISHAIPAHVPNLSEAEFSCLYNDEAK